MIISEEGIQLIKSCEGFRASVYLDNGVPAIAYGHRLLPGESFPNGVTEAQADAILANDLSTRFEPMLNPRVPASCLQGEYDALGSFVYNVENQPKSLEQVLAHGWDQLPAQLPRWCHELKDGVWVENAGLKARRQREVEMILAARAAQQV